jgi:hypothetical protein
MPFSSEMYGVPTGFAILSAVNTVSGSNTSFGGNPPGNSGSNAPQGDTVWITNPNTSQVQFVTLTNTSSNTGGNTAWVGAISIPPGWTVPLKAPWLPGTPGSQCWISAIMNTGSNTSALFATAGYAGKV